MHLKKFITKQLQNFKIFPTQEMSDVIVDISNETSDGDKIQCTQGADLLGTMPGSEDVMDTYGWHDPKRDGDENVVNDGNGTAIIQKVYDQAGDLITNKDGKIDPLLLTIGKTTRLGADILRIDSFSIVKVGDKIVVPKSPALPDGHVVVVIGKWIDYKEIHI